MPPPHAAPGNWDLDALWTALTTLYPVGIGQPSLKNSHAKPDPQLTRKKLLAALINDAQDRLADREAEVDAVAGEGAMRTLERDILLDAIDRKWREHLYEMDYLKAGIGLRALAQHDPLVEYHREGYDMFIAMLDGLKEDCIRSLFHTAVQATPATPVVPATAPPMMLIEPAALPAIAAHAAAQDDRGSQRHTAASR